MNEPEKNAAITQGACSLHEDGMRSAGEDAEKQRCPVCLGTKVSWYNAAMGRKRPCRKCDGTGVIGASHTSVIGRSPAALSQDLPDKHEQNQP